MDYYLKVIIFDILEIVSLILILPSRHLPFYLTEQLEYSNYLSFYVSNIAHSLNLDYEYEFL